MKLLCYILALYSVFLTRADAQPPVNNASWNSFYARQKELRQLGAKALEEERSRGKKELCSQALKGGNVSLQLCMNKELKATDSNYLQYARSIGGLLRLTPPNTKSGAPVLRLPFDQAEATWARYRKQACSAMAEQWQGGDQAPVAYVDCAFKLTWRHLDELAEFYSDLWH